MLSDTQLLDLIKVYQRRMEEITNRYFRLMGEHLERIGTLTPSDVHRLTEMRRAGMNLDNIQRAFTRATRMSVNEMNSLFVRVAQEDYRLAEQYLFRRPRLDPLKNVELLRIIEAQARQTAGTLANLSRTTLVSDAYREAVDVAVRAVHSGVADYQSAIRESARKTASEGLRVRYPSGTTRRLDSAVRQNVLDGVRQLQMNIMRQIGRDFGADGVEITAHALCAEDHLPFQGMQYSWAQFDAIQASLDRPIGQWNCRHMVSPVVLGVSEPTHTDGQLASYRNNSTEQVTIGKVTKSRYEWTQSQRKIETAIRNQKDVANLAKVVGDDKLRREAQRKINDLDALYGKISRQAKLLEARERMAVPGFRRVGTLRKPTRP